MRRFAKFTGGKLSGGRLYTHIKKGISHRRVVRGRCQHKLQRWMSKTSSFCLHRKYSTRESTKGFHNPDPLGILSIIPQIEQLTGRNLDRPRLVSIGDQSGGKSSLLESLIGFDLFPKGSGMVSKRPLNIVLEHNPSGFWIEFDDGQKIYNIDEARKRIEDENKAAGSAIIDDPIFVKICSRDVSPLSVVDLPGFINNVKKGQNPELPEMINRVNQPYLEDPGSIPLIVQSATEDPQNSKALRKVQKHQSMDRALGVVTKIDKMKVFDSVIETLQNTNYPLHYGWFGCVLRGPKDIEAGTTLKEMHQKEREFFKSHKLDTVPGIRLGVRTIQHQLTQISLQNVVPQLPTIIDQLDQIIKQEEHDVSFLTQLASEPDLETVSADLEIIVKNLHPESESRSRFEDRARRKLHKEIANKINSVIDSTKFTKWFEPEVERELDPLMGENMDVVNPAIDMHIPKVADSVLSRTHDNIQDFVNHNFIDRLRRMFGIFGDSCPDKVTNQIIQKVKLQSMEGSLLIGYFNLLCPDMNSMGIEWRKDQRKFIDTLIDPTSPNNLQTISFSLIMNELRSFINNIDIQSKDKTKTDLARKFGNYLFNKIGSKIYKDGLESSLYHLINTEKRTDLNVQELGMSLVKVTGHPSTFPRKLTKEFPFVKFNHPGRTMNIPIYGPEYTKAYTDMEKRVIPDLLFRSIGENLMEPLMYEAINHALKTFKGDKLTLEAEKQGRKLLELREYRKKLAKANDEYFKPSYTYKPPYSLLNK